MWAPTVSNKILFEYKIALIEVNAVKTETALFTTLLEDDPMNDAVQCSYLTSRMHYQGHFIWDVASICDSFLEAHRAESK